MTRTLLSADSPAIHTDVDEGARGGQVRRIVICEDSRTYASALTRALEHDGAHSVVGVFSSAEETLDALPSLQPDLVTVDLELPGISGLVAIERIMRTGPVPILVLSAHLGEPGKTPGAALAAGALDALPKSRLDLRDPAGVDASALRRRADLLGGARLHRPPAARAAVRRPCPSFFVRFRPRFPHPYSSCSTSRPDSWTDSPGCSTRRSRCRCGSRAMASIRCVASRSRPTGRISCSASEAA